MKIHKHNAIFYLTNSLAQDKIGLMSKIFDEIRKAIRTSGITRYRLWIETGLDQALLARFMSAKSGLSVESIEKLVDVLGLEIIIQPKTTKKRKVKDGKHSKRLKRA
jgi:hypothetical protein